VDPLSPRQLNRAIHAAAEEAHLGKRVSMHSGIIPRLTCWNRRGISA
jgi:hypothetical protein